MKMSKFSTGKFNSSPEFFEIGSPLGRGKYSEVHEGVDIRSDTQVVIKLLKPV
jgi:serine/threonine protein kinase